MAQHHGVFSDSNSLGRRTVTFRIGKIQRTFTLPEDLICRSSQAFRQLLQKNRKTVDGECSICHETLDADEDEITFCRARCGQNFHERCMDQWKVAESGPTKCPICRQVWKSLPNHTIGVMNDIEGIDDKDAMHVYCDWLYTGTIQIDEDVPRDSEEFGLRILKAHNLASQLNDMDFRNAVVANYIAENRFAKGFWSTAINYVWVELGTEDELEEGDDEHDDGFDDRADAPEYAIERFVIDNFIKAMDSRFFQRHASTFPKLFVRMLSQRLLEKTLRPSHKNILEEHAYGDYEIDE